MVLTELPHSALSTLRDASGYLTDLLTPTVRVGVTGLSRSGKTVFITALIRNLTAGGRLPFFTPAAEGRIVRAYLEPQPDDAVPRFSYEEHLAALARTPPQWPESTRRISQLRVTVEYRSASRIKRSLWVNKLHVDIVDYPGEWLIDLPLMEQTYAEWSQGALSLARAPHRAGVAAEWLTHLAQISPDADQSEDVAREGARIFTAYLQAARAAETSLSIAGPGRFLMPGDLEGSPLLTFFPLPDAADAAQRRGSLAAMMERRFESYKTHVVRPFFRDHFSRLDRQIVLVDVLSALNAGPAGVADLEQALGAVLGVFRAGAASWLMQWIAPRIDRIAFAATKADHLHSASHDRLEALLAALTARASRRATGAGADIRFLALAALRATREGQVSRGGEKLDCLIGTPLPGEIIGEERFDGTRSAAIFPGDLPTPSELATPEGLAALARHDISVVRFRPPAMPTAPGAGPETWPHIRLDRALEFLIGDHLA